MSSRLPRPDPDLSPGKGTWKGQAALQVQHGREELQVDVEWVRREASKALPLSVRQRRALMQILSNSRDAAA